MQQHSKTAMAAPEDKTILETFVKRFAQAAHLTSWPASREVIAVFRTRDYGGDGFVREHWRLRARVPAR
jgi:hypothetical protein